MNCLPGINAVYTGLVRRALQRRVSGTPGVRRTVNTSAHRCIEGNQVTRLSDRAVVLLTVGAFAAVVVGIAVIGAILAG